MVWQEREMWVSKGSEDAGARQKQRERNERNKEKEIRKEEKQTARTRRNEMKKKGTTKPKKRKSDMRFSDREAGFGRPLNFDPSYPSNHGAFCLMELSQNFH
jgi:hypothetical protein